jgi:ferredoxin--NADP+ reductase
VLEIRHWTPSLLSFRTTRQRGFRFTPGHYTRLGLGGPDDTVWRPFSLASASLRRLPRIHRGAGPGRRVFEQLGQLRVGDALRVDKASYGFLTVDQLAPGKDLWLLASGTGLGPFLSILRDPAVWQNYRRLILVHSVRQSAELAWRDEIAALPRQELLAEAAATLSYIPIVTREPGATALAERIPLLLADGRLEAAAGTRLSLSDSRLMVCGNPEMARELQAVPQLTRLRHQPARPAGPDGLREVLVARNATAKRAHDESSVLIRPWQNRFLCTRSTPSGFAGVVTNIAPSIPSNAATVPTAPSTRPNCSAKTGWSMATGTSMRNRGRTGSPVTRTDRDRAGQGRVP